jgi:hypothetical protein
MDRIRTRVARGAGVGVNVCVAVGVGVSVAVEVLVGISVMVEEGVYVAGRIAGAEAVGIRHATSNGSANDTASSARVLGFIMLE